MAKIILSDGAEKDLQDDLIWYENKQKDLSAKYLTDYLDTEKGIKNNPKGFPMFRLGFRKALFKLFRHAVFFKVKEENEEEVIAVAAVVHQSRSEKTILEKLKRKD